MVYLIIFLFVCTNMLVYLGNHIQSKERAKVELKLDAVVSTLMSHQAYLRAGVESDKYIKAALTASLKNQTGLMVEQQEILRRLQE
jgi:hypothetical protein